MTTVTEVVTNSNQLVLLKLLKRAYYDGTFKSPTRDYSRYRSISAKAYDMPEDGGEEETLSSEAKEQLRLEWEDKYENTEPTIQIDPYYAAVYSRIGHALAQGAGKGDEKELVGVLDIGSGPGITARQLVGDLGQWFSYTSIDLKPSRVTIPNLAEQRHLETDIFSDDDSNLLVLEKEKYTVLIVDIEPHGREIEIYQRVCQFLKPDHLVIFKCLGCIDQFGCMAAKKVLDCLSKQDRLKGFCGEMMNPNLKDLIVIAGSPTSVD